MQSNEAVSRLQRSLETREKQLTDMATVLSETHHKLNNALVQNRILSIENIDLNKKLERKEVDMQKEIKEKQDILKELQALKLERDQLKTKLKEKDEEESNIKVRSRTFQIETSPRKSEQVIENRIEKSKRELGIKVLTDYFGETRDKHKHAGNGQRIALADKENVSEVL